MYINNFFENEMNAAYTDSFDRIKEDFVNGTRNTYDGVLVSYGDKTASYQLSGTDVIGRVHVKDFSFNHISFNDFAPPARIPVVIKEIFDDKITLSTIPSFGSFGENIERFEISEGKQLVGFATKQVAFGVMVMLAPNLTTLIEAPSHIVNSFVTVEVSSIIPSKNKIKANFLGFSEHNPFADGFDAFITPHTLPDFVDANAFTVTNRPGRKTEDTACESSEVEKEVEPPSFEFESTESLFRTVDYTEVVNFDSVSMNHRSVAWGIETGDIDQELTDIARAVDTLKFTTSNHLKQYMYITTGKTFSNAQLQRKLTKLVNYRILRRCWFSSPDETEKKTPYLYCRGSEFKRVSTYLSHHSHIPQSGMPAIDIKGRLASNQLLIGLIRAFRGIEFLANYKHEATGPKYLFSRYVLRRSDGIALYPGSVRCSAEDEEHTLRKLERYNDILGLNDIVILTCENEKHLAHVEKLLEEHEFKFHVRLITDLECYDSEKLNCLTTVISDSHSSSSATAKTSAKKGLIGSLISKIGFTGIFS